MLIGSHDFLSRNDRASQFFLCKVYGTLTSEINLWSRWFGVITTKRLKSWIVEKSVNTVRVMRNIGCEPTLTTTILSSNKNTETGNWVVFQQHRMNKVVCVHLFKDWRSQSIIKPKSECDSFKYILF